MTAVIDITSIPVGAGHPATEVVDSHLLQRSLMPAAPPPGGPFYCNRGSPPSDDSPAKGRPDDPSSEGKIGRGSRVRCFLDIASLAHYSFPFISRLLARLSGDGAAIGHFAVLGNQCLLYPTPVENVFLSPGELDVYGSNGSGIVDIILADFEDHPGLFRGVRDVGARYRFEVRGHRMGVDDARATIPFCIELRKCALRVPFFAETQSGRIRSLDLLIGW